MVFFRKSGSRPDGDNGVHRLREMKGNAWKSSSDLSDDAGNSLAFYLSAKALGFYRDDNLGIYGKTVIDWTILWIRP